MIKIVQGLVLAASIVLASPLAMAEGNVASGQAKSAVCSACHGVDGNSPSADFPKLAGMGEKYLTKQMQDIKSGVRTVPAMAGMLASLSDQDLADIAAYYSGNTRSIAGATERDLELGEQIYRVGMAENGVPACQGCHSPTGSGNAPAGFPALGGQYAAYLTKQLQAFRTGADDPENPAARTNDGEARPMRDAAARLSDREIEAVSNYISGLH